VLIQGFEGEVLLAASPMEKLDGEDDDIC